LGGHQHFMHTFFVQKCFAQLSSVTFWLCNFLAQGYWQKRALKILVKLTPGGYPIREIFSSLMVDHFSSYYNNTDGKYKLKYCIVI